MPLAKSAFQNIGGVLRDATGAWNSAVFLDAGIVLVGFMLLLFVREQRAPVGEKRTSEGTETSEPEGTP